MSRRFLCIFFTILTTFMLVGCDGCDDDGEDSGSGNPVAATNEVYVSGYTRSDGTYVKGHYRTAPNDTKKDNYSTKGNTNPHTGKKGTK